MSSVTKCDACGKTGVKLTFSLQYLDSTRPTVGPEFCSAACAVAHLQQHVEYEETVRAAREYDRLRIEAARAKVGAY